MCPRIFRLSGLKRLHVCHGCLDHFVNNANYASLCGNYEINAKEEITWKRQNKLLIPSLNVSSDYFLVCQFGGGSYCLNVDKSRDTAPLMAR